MRIRGFLSRLAAPKDAIDSFFSRDPGQTMLDDVGAL